MKDINLIRNIKANLNADECLKILHDRHYGIFYRMLSSYVPHGAIFADREELISDSKYYIYKFALAFNEDRNTKFSTFLGNRTRWMCLNMYNKSKRGQEICQGDEPFLNLHSPADQFRDEMINKELIGKIFESLKSLEDKRVVKIFTMRYIDGEKNKVMPWKKICKEVGLSIQGCINLHNSHIKKIKSKKIN